MATDADSDADFRPLEWLALFPTPSPPMKEFGDDERRAGPDDAPRAADPLTRDGVLRNLSGAAWLASWSALRLHCALPGGAGVPVAALLGATGCALLGLALPLAGAAIAPKDAAIGIAGVAVICAGNLAMFAVSRHGMGANLLGALDYTAPAGLCRWLQLVRAGAPEAADKHGSALGALLAHVPGDEDCLCASCCAWVQNAAGTLSLLYTFVYNVLLGELLLFLFVYTPLVTYGTALWSTPYGGLLGALYVLAMVSGIVVSWLANPLGVGNVGFTALERRLHCRAASLAMDDLLMRFRAAAAEGSGPPRASSWLYVRLHYRFAAMCRSRRRQDGALISQIYGAVLVPCVVFFAVLSAAVGRCIPAWQLVYLAHAAIYFATNAVNLASRNALIDSVLGVHLSAERDLRTLVLSVGPGALADDAAMHCSALASFGEVQRHRARLFGFVVSYGSVRTLLATGTTVAVALWTVLRAFGVSAKWESFCFSGI